MMSATECNDGTICENFTPCAPHPIKEGSYMCDCTTTYNGAYNRFTDVVKYAGVYCEHDVTSYCERGSETSVHAFCANGGECKMTVGWDEEHAGCKCPAGYAGNHCQFVEGSVPRGWSLGDFMHPALLGARAIGPYEGMSMEGVIAIIGLCVVGSAIIIIILGVYLTSGARLTFTFGDKDLDTGAAGEQRPLHGAEPGAGTGILVEVRRRSAAALETIRVPQYEDFVGGGSTNKRKASTGQHVTEDTLEADGSVLKKALEEKDGIVGVMGEEEAIMEEVPLDSAPGSLDGEAGVLT